MTQMTYSEELARRVCAGADNDRTAGIPGLRSVDSDVVADLLAVIDRLRADLDNAQLRSIEVSNPGIDMDEVRRLRSRSNTERRTSPDRPSAP